ncbi:hypothetical protein MBLNU457_5229t1 [Dothideomycetes sp. NU457]
MSNSSTNASTETGPVFFWREFEQPYGFLSQWYESTFEHEGVNYTSTEMWMMYQKAKLFGDEAIAEEMLDATKPAQFKALGRKVKGFDEKKWNANKLRIVEEGNYLKFTKCENHTELSKMLLATGEREIVEASPYDKIWGIGFKADGAERCRKHWGQNLLGIAITNVRTRLRKEQSG